MRESPRPPGLAAVLATGVAAFLLAHFAAKPGLDFVLDDWSNLRDALGQPRWFHPTRPLSVAAIMLAFKWLHGFPAAFLALSMLVHAACALLVMLCAWRLTRSLPGTLAAGLVLAGMPTLYENIQWPTMIVGAGLCCLLPALASLHFWLAYVRGRRPRDLLLSAFLYALALSAYEAGAFLPMVFPLVARGFTRREWMRAAAAFLVFLAPVLAWRFTGAFGLANFGQAPQFTPATDPSLLSWNARQAISWLAGPVALQALRNGLSGWALLHPAQAGVFLAAFLALGAWGARKAFRAPPSDASSWRRGTAAGVALCVAGMLPIIPAYACSRLQYFQAAGLAIAVAAVVPRLGARRGFVPAAALALVGMVANQGTSVQWSRAGAFGRALQRHINTPVSVAAWRSAELAYFDTRGLPGAGTYAVAPRFGNAELIRGYVAATIFPVRAPDGGRSPPVVLDFESGARLQGDALLWHLRYRPDQARTNRLERVFVVRCADFWPRRE